jgi:hypothetical protein
MFVGHGMSNASADAASQRSIVGWALPIRTKTRHCARSEAIQSRYSAAPTLDCRVTCGFSQ